MKIELHFHTSRYSACSVLSPEEAFEAARGAGYEAVFVTEHNALWTPAELADARESCPGLGIFSGVEVTLDEELLQHMLILGADDPEYLHIRDPFAVVEKARGDGLLTVMAHPCRYPGACELLDRGLRPDAIEHCTCNQEFDRCADARALAARLGLPMVNAGDVHGLDMIGRHWIETAAPVEDPRALRELVLRGAYENRSLHSPVFDA